MERLSRKANNLQQVDLIITADWHLREDTPVCRIDNFWDAQWTKVKFVADLHIHYGCPVFHAGDLFHHWKPSPLLLNTTMKYLPKSFISVYGNHDLPQHSIELREKSGLIVLEQSEYVSTFVKGSWGMPLLRLNVVGKIVGLWHIFTYKGKQPWPGCTAKSAKELLEETDVDLLITGDNHVPFVEKHDGKLLVNPGSLMRQDADQIDYKPAVWLWEASTNRVQPVYLPIDENAVTREHIDKVEQKNEMLESFISGLNKEWDISLSFKKNIERYTQANNISEKIVKLLYELID